MAAVVLSKDVRGGDRTLGIQPRLWEYTKVKIFFSFSAPLLTECPGWIYITTKMLQGSEIDESFWHYHRFPEEDIETTNNDSSNLLDRLQIVRIPRVPGEKTILFYTRMNARVICLRLQPRSSEKRVCTRHIIVFRSSSCQTSWISYQQMRSKSW